MPENCGSSDVSGFRPCVVYGDQITYSQRDKYGALIAAAGWRAVAWEYDDRSLIGEQLPDRPGLVRALAKAAVDGVPLLLPDRHDVRGEIDLLKAAAGGRTLGVEVRTLPGPVLGSPLYRDEMEHAAKVLLTETLALRDAVNAALTVRAADAHAAVADWAAPRAAAETTVRTPATSAATATVIDMSRRFRDWYDRTAAQMTTWGVAVPPLPDRAAPWRKRRRQVGTLAAGLQRGGWNYDRICGLLRELGVKSETGLDFYPGLLAYYRRTANDYKAA